MTLHDLNTLFVFAELVQVLVVELLKRPLVLGKCLDLVHIHLFKSLCLQE